MMLEKINHNSAAKQIHINAWETNNKEYVKKEQSTEKHDCFSRKPFKDITFRHKNYKATSKWKRGDQAYEKHKIILYAQ